MRTIGEDHAIHAYFNPYEELDCPADACPYPENRRSGASIRRFVQFSRKRETTAILDHLTGDGKAASRGHGCARPVRLRQRAKGAGEVVSALCEGLTERGFDVHLAILNLKKRFQTEAQMNELQWREVRYKIDSDKIHLVSSSIFADSTSAYAGDPILTAVEFQREIVNNVIKTVRARSEGRLIIHSRTGWPGG